MTDLPADLATLVEDLRSPDPLVRDDGAFSALAERAHAGDLDDHLAQLGDRSTALLADGAVQARTFGALLLALVVDRDNRTGRADDASVRRWLAAACRWYAAEPDTRGWNDELGWLHAVAHGADALGELAASARLGADDLVALLGALVRRTVTATALHWLQNEDDRVALAVMAVLRRDLVEGDQVRAAVDRLAAAWRDVAPGQASASTDNALRMARTLHLQLTLGVRREPGTDVAHPAVRQEALQALGAALADRHWFYGRPK